jgi:tetratricopeptide (TPR) repeat protein
VPAIRVVVKALDETSQAEAADAARARLAEVITVHAAPPDAPAAPLMDAAMLAMEQKNYPAAIEYYKRALILNPVRADWHTQYARALAADGRIQQAIEAARIAEGLGWTGAQDFILELRLRPTSKPATVPGN